MSPLSNLDAALRVNMRLEISELHQQLKTTMIYVTHDQVEAMTMADKIVVLNRGNIEAGRFAARPLSQARQPLRCRFIGSPRNEPHHRGLCRSKGWKDWSAFVPEHIGLSKDAGTWEGTVTVAEHLGSDTSCI